MLFYIDHSSLDVVVRLLVVVPVVVTKAQPQVTYIRRPDKLEKKTLLKKIKFKYQTHLNTVSSSDYEVFADQNCATVMSEPSEGLVALQGNL